MFKLQSWLPKFSSAGKSAIVITGLKGHCLKTVVCSVTGMFSYSSSASILLDDNHDTHECASLLIQQMHLL